MLGDDEVVAKEVLGESDWQHKHLCCVHAWRVRAGQRGHTLDKRMRDGAGMAARSQC